MENISVNKAEQYEQYVVKYFQIDAACMIIGLLWSAICVFALQRPQLMYTGGLLFLVTLFVPKLKFQNPDKKTIFLLILAAYVGLLIALELMSIKLGWDRKLVVAVIFLLTLALSAYWIIAKMKVWRKFEKEKIVDERMNTLLDKAKNVSFYIIIFGVAIVYLMMTLGISRIDHNTAVALLFNAFLLWRLSYSAAFLVLRRTN